MAVIITIIFVLVYFRKNLRTPCRKLWFLVLDAQNTLNINQQNEQITIILKLLKNMKQQYKQRKINNENI